MRRWRKVPTPRQRHDRRVRPDSLRHVQRIAYLPQEVGRPIQIATSRMLKKSGGGVRLQNRIDPQ